jgi:hypothetical protein
MIGKMNSSKKYYQENKEKIKAQALEYYYTNKEKAALNNKKYYLKNKDKLQAYSKEYNKKWYQDNKEKRDAQKKEYNKINKEKIKLQKQEYELKKKYGITLKERNILLQKQNNKCKICSLKFNENIFKLKACVDHCHETEKIRGLLCRTCNAGLGYFKDNIEQLTKAINYLKETK